MHLETRAGERFCGEGYDVWICLAPGGRRQIMVARSFVAQRLLDENMVGRRAEIMDLTRRRDPDQELAPRNERLLRHEDGERSSDSMADDAVVHTIGDELPKLGVIARPDFGSGRSQFTAHIVDDVAIGIEDADCGHHPRLQALLPSRFSQHVLGSESRCLPVVAPLQQRNLCEGRNSDAHVCPIAMAHAVPLLGAVDAVEDLLRIVAWTATRSFHQGSRRIANVRRSVGPRCTSVSNAIPRRLSGE